MVNAIGSKEAPLTGTLDSVIAFSHLPDSKQMAPSLSPVTAAKPQSQINGSDLMKGDNDSSESDFRLEIINSPIELNPQKVRRR